MSERSVSRALLKIGALTTAAVFALGGAATGALAQEPETPSSSVEPTPTTGPSTPPSTTEPAPSAEPAPSPTPSSEPSAPAEPSTPTTPSPPATDRQEQKATPAPVPANVKVPDLAVVVYPDKQEFLPGEDIGMNIVVTNMNETTATNVRFGYESPGAWLVKGADVLSSRPSVQQGQQMLFRVVLRPTSPSSSTVPFAFRATVDGLADPTPGDNGTDIDIKVRQHRGKVSGVVYLDKNGNGTIDQGEGLPGAWIGMQGGLPHGPSRGLADANGAFTIFDVPTGKHTVWTVDRDNKYVVQPGFADFVVERDQETKIMVPVVSPVSSSLSGSMAFDRNSYAPADQVGLDVTLRNSGTQPIVGVVAVCRNYGPEYLTSDSWGALSPDAGGVTVPAGGEIKVRVTTSVPKGLRFTTFYASCSFGNAGRNENGYTSAVTAYASVHGVFGRVYGKVVNAETGKPITNTSVGVLDAVTRRPLKDLRTDYEGTLFAYDVPVGKVVFVVAGKWAPKDGKEFTADIVADTSISPELRVVPSETDVPEFAKHQPDFTVTVKFDKDSYDIAEPARAHVTVKNVGTGYESGVNLSTAWDSGTNEFEFDRTQLGEFADLKDVRLWPGESRELTLVGRVPLHLRGENKMALGFSVLSWEDQNEGNNKAFARASITFLKGDAVVVLYGDRNGNKKMDAGEELADTRLTLSGGNSPSTWKDGTTDASGRAWFRDLPVGVFQVSAYYKDGWVRHERAELTVSANAESVFEVGAVRPISDKLPASIRFVKREYAAGERYEADITITNNTGADLPAVKMHCSGSGEDGEIYNSGADWGPLASNGSGVPVANGRTSTFRVSGEQPAKSPSVGYGSIDCSIAPDYTDPGATRVSDQFRVLGQRADAIGRLMKDDDNPGLDDVAAPGVVLVLVDHISQKVVTRTITDETGRFKVTNLPVARYDVVVPGPWKIKYYRMNPWFHVRADVRAEEQVLWLAAGPEVEDPGYPLPEDETPGTNTPAPVAGSGGGGEALAKTGASVLGLGLVGALLVAFGFGASMVGRRKTV